MDLSEIIAKYINSVDEVKFGSYAPGSLCYNICNEMNKKACKKHLYKLKYSWFKNDDLKESVSCLLAQKQNTLTNLGFIQENTNQSICSIVTCSMSELSDSVCKMSISSDSSFKEPSLSKKPSTKLQEQFIQQDKNYKISNSKFVSNDNIINKVSLKSYLTVLFEKKQICSCRLSFYSL